MAIINNDTGKGLLFQCHLKIIYLLLCLFTAVEVAAQGEVVYNPAEDYRNDGTPLYNSMNWKTSGRGQEVLDSMLEFAGMEQNNPSCFSDSKIASVYDENAFFRTIPMQCMTSADGDFQLWLSPPIVYTDSVKDSFRKYPEAKRLFYNWEDGSQFVVLLGEGLASMNPNLQHHKYVVKDKAKNVKYYSDAFARDMFNADTVMLYDAPEVNFKTIRKNDSIRMKRMKCGIYFSQFDWEDMDFKYNHFKKLIIQKHDQGYVLAYCMFTDKGVKQADKYIKGLKGLVRYKDGHKALWRQKTADFLAERKYAVALSRFKEDSVAFSLPSGYVYCKNDFVDIDGKKCLIVRASVFSTMSNTLLCQSADGKELVSYTSMDSSSESYLLSEECKHLGFLLTLYREIPSAFNEKFVYNTPKRSSFRVSENNMLEVDSLFVWQGATSAQKHFMLRTERRNGDLYIELLDGKLPHMQIFRAVYGGKVLWICRFSAEEFGSETLPKELFDSVRLNK